MKLEKKTTLRINKGYPNLGALLRKSKPTILTFQLTAGKKIASIKMPSRGPHVADIIMMEISIIPVI